MNCIVIIRRVLFVSGFSSSVAAASVDDGQHVDMVRVSVWRDGEPSPGNKPIHSSRKTVFCKCFVQVRKLYSVRIAEKLNGQLIGSN